MLVASTNNALIYSIHCIVMKRITLEELEKKKKMNYTRVHNSIHQLVVQFDTIVWNKHELKWHSFCE